MTENEAIEYFYRIMEDGTIKSDEQQIAYETAIDTLEEIQQYRSIGTVSECREAVEKQRAKKPIDGKMRKCVGYYQCPICGGLLTTNKGFCEDCGQAIDFSKESLKITRHVKQ